MTTPVRAVYENGHLRLLDPIEPEPGQMLTVQIVENETPDRQDKPRIA